MQWTRTPLGYVSDDRRWFLERGGRMTHGTNAWLIWRRATEDEVVTDQYGSFGRLHNEPVRKLGWLANDERLGSDLFIDTLTEGGWLKEAKEIVEILAKDLTLGTVSFKMNL